MARHQKDIRRFNTAIKWMRRLEVLFALIPIKYTLKMWGLSNEFIDSMILPSLALFLGTGNATPNLPTVMMERLYTSPTYGMWYKIDEHSLSSNLPPMVVFPESTKFYTAWKEDMERKGVKVRLSLNIVGADKRGSGYGQARQLLCRIACTRISEQMSGMTRTELTYRSASIPN